MTDTFTGIYREYYKSGKLKSEVYISNGKKEGPHKIYYQNFNRENINIRTIRNYIDGVLHGESITYYLNGNIDIKCNYINNNKEGNELKYYSNGKIQRISKYVKNELQNTYNY